MDWVTLSFEYARSAQTDVTFLYDQYIKKASILNSINEQKFAYSVYYIDNWEEIQRGIWIYTIGMPSLVFRTNKKYMNKHNWNVFFGLPYVQVSVPSPPPRIRILNISGLENIPLGNDATCLQGLCILKIFYDACYLLASMDHKKKTFMFKNTCTFILLKRLKSTLLILT